MEKAVPRYRGAGCSISVSAVPFGPGTDFFDLAGMSVPGRIHVLICLVLLVVLGCLMVGEFFGVLIEFGYTGKPQHTLQDLAGVGGSSESRPREIEG